MNASAKGEGMFGKISDFMNLAYDAVVPSSNPYQ